MSDTVAARLIVEAAYRDGGVARWLRDLEAQAKHSDSAAARFARTLAGLGQGTGRGGGLPQIPGLPSGGGGSAPRAPAAPGRSQLPDTGTATREALALAQTQARGAAAAGNYTGALTILTSALNQSTGISARHRAAIDNQVAAYQRASSAGDQATGAFGRVGSALSGITRLAAASGIALGTQQLIEFGRGSVDLALRTEQATNSLKALAGSPKLYADALATAREQQRLFGGSLAENIEGIQGLITVSRSSGAELSRLVDLASRLSVKDPAQGIAGARIALNEALAGDPTSLAKRYEIPRAALAALRDESTSTADKLTVIDDYLAGIGITSEVVAGSIPKATLAFNALGAAGEQAVTRLGSAIAEKLAPVAEELTRLLTVGDTFQTQQATIVAAAGSYDAYTAAIARMNAQLGLSKDPVLQALAGTEQLTEAQFTFAQALIAQGTAVDQAVAKAQSLKGVFAEIASGREAFRSTISEDTTAYDALAARLLKVAASGDEFQRATVEALLRARPPLEDLTSATQQLEQAQLQQANAAALAAQREGERSAGIQTATADTYALADAVYEEAAAQLAVAAASDRAAGVQDAMNQMLDQALTRHLDAAGAAQMLATTFGISEQAAYAAANAYYAAQDAAAAFAMVSGGLSTFQGAAGLANQRSGERGGSGSAGVDAAITRALTLRNRALSIPRVAQERAAKGGGGGRAKQSQAEKDAEKLLGIQEDYGYKREDLEREHQEKLAEIAAEGAKKRAEADQKYNQERLDSSAGFYGSIRSLDNRFRIEASRRYEEAVNTANELARTQGADAGEAYLGAARDAIKGQVDLEAEIAGLRSTTTDGGEKKEKGQFAADQNEADYLQGVLNLQKRADDARLQQITDRGSAIAAEEQQQRDAELAAYEQHLDEMRTVYERKTKDLPGFAATLGPPPAPGDVGAARVQSAGTSAPASTSGGAAAAGGPPSGGATLVAAPGTDAALDQGFGRLEGKLSEQGGKLDEVVRALSSVERAIGGLKVTSAFSQR